MSARYRMARALATLASIPELSERLNESARRFEDARAAAGYAGREHTPGAAATAAAAFDNLYAQAALALTEASDGTLRLDAAGMAALETMVARTEQAEAAYESALRGVPTQREPAPVVRQAGVGGLAPILFGALFLGGVLYLTRR